MGEIPASKRVVCARNGKQRLILRDIFG
jgi:hypothetical protein